MSHLIRRLRAYRSHVASHGMEPPCRREDPIDDIVCKKPAWILLSLVRNCSQLSDMPLTISGPTLSTRLFREDSNQGTTCACITDEGFLGRSSFFLPPEMDYHVGRSINAFKEALSEESKKK